jgi:uncharacterized protein YjiK
VLRRVRAGWPAGGVRGRRRAAAWTLVAAVGCGMLTGIVTGCGGGSSPTAPQPVPQLTLLETHPLAIPQPSDVTIDDSGTRLWMVGNHPEMVYQLDLQGHLVKTLSYVGQDLEGVAFDRRDSTLWVAEENLHRVVHLDLDGNVLLIHDLGFTTEHNSGLEGICLNDSSRMFVLNEKNPGIFVGLDTGLNVASMDTITFARDFSGMTWNPQKKCFWIVSDQSDRLFLWNPTNTTIAQYELPFPKPEGVAFDPVSNRVYVVSDSTNMMYVFQNTSGSAPAGAR